MNCLKLALYIFLNILIYDVHSSEIFQSISEERFEQATESALNLIDHVNSGILKFHPFAQSIKNFEGLLLAPFKDDEFLELTASDLDEMINKNSIKPILEIGANENPMCLSKECIYLDHNESALKATKKALNVQDSDFFAIEGDATKSEGIPIDDLTFERVITKGFPWFVAPTHLVQILDIKNTLQEMMRVLDNDGQLIIMSKYSTQMHSNVFLARIMGTTQLHYKDVSAKDIAQLRYYLHSYVAKELGFIVIPFFTDTLIGLIVTKK